MLLQKPLSQTYLVSSMTELNARIEELGEILFQRHVYKKYDEKYFEYDQLLRAYKLFRENDRFVNNLVRELFFV